MKVMNNAQMLILQVVKVDNLRQTPQVGQFRIHESNHNRIL
jgi:hypothetical protein